MRPAVTRVRSLLPFLVLILGLLPARAAESWSMNEAVPFSAERGFGYDFNTAPNHEGNPVYFSIAKVEGNLRVSVTVEAIVDTEVTVKAESRQLFVERAPLSSGRSATYSFILNVRNPRLRSPEKNAPGGNAVALNDREKSVLRWDDKLTVEIHGRVRPMEITVEPAAVPTVFLLGDSTVTDQNSEPGASWGQMLPRFMEGVAVANHAESGETLKSFVTGLRLAKVLESAHEGDYALLQFGHNDQKKQWPQTYVEAGTTYKSWLRVFVKELQIRGVTPLLCTSVERRNFDPENRIKPSLGGYPQAVREVAAELGLIVIDLERDTRRLYEAWGPELAPRAFSDQGRDQTHHNNFGAYEIAKCVARALRASALPLSQQVRPEVATFDPAHPDSPADFALPESPLRSDLRPRGN